MPSGTTYIDLDFARRSVHYLRNNHCSASQIIEALTDELDLPMDLAQDLVAETMTPVAA